jgi:ankyrin repeat protein
LVVAQLLAVGVAVDEANNEGSTPLLVSVGEDHAEVVAKLFVASATVDNANNKGSTPLFVFAYKGHAEVVAKPLAAGADKTVNSKLGTPYEIAKKKGDVEIMALFG